MNRDAATMTKFPPDIKEFITWIIHTSRLVQIRGALSEDVVNYLELSAQKYLC
jgi:hypothetical protein